MTLRTSFWIFISVELSKSIYKGILMIAVRIIFILLIILTSVSPVYPAEIEGFTFPEVIVLNQKELVLNGLGTRKATIFHFKVFSAGLYLTKHSNIAEQILLTNDPKSLHIRFLKNLTASKIAEVWEDELIKRCTKNCTSLKAKSKELGELMIDFKKADSLQFNFFNDHVQVVTGLSQNGVIVSHDFSLALISLWIGDKPLSSELKKSLLNLKEESGAEPN